MDSKSYVNISLRILLCISLLVISVLSSNLVYARTPLSSFMPSVGNVQALDPNLKDVKIYYEHTFPYGYHMVREFTAGYTAKDNPGFSMHVDLAYASSAGSLKNYEGYYTRDGFSCSIKGDYLGCSKVSKSSFDSWKYNKEFKYVKIVNYDGCNASSCYSNDASMIVVEVKVLEGYNFTDVASQLGYKLASLVVSKINGRASNTPKIIIESPSNNQVIYYNNYGANFNVKVKVSGSDIKEVGAHYEAGGVFVGGRVNGVGSNGGEGTITIQLSPSDIKSNAKVVAYAKTSSGKSESSINIYLKKIGSSQSSKSSVGSHSSVSSHTNVKSSSSSSQSSKREVDLSNSKLLKGVRSKPILFNDLSSKFNRMNNIVDQNKVNLRNKQLSRILKNSAELVSVKTLQGNEIRALQSDDMVAKAHPNVEKNSASWFKFKYGLNKHVLGKVVDVITDNLPIIKNYKDYFKSDVETNLFNSKEDVKKTMKDLGVDKRSASLYNQFSGVEDREKALSPLKNAVSLPKSAKPMEFAVDAMTMGTKKIIAHYYKKEYNYVVGLAKYYRNAGMKWSDVHKAVVRDLDENKGGITGLSSAKENAASQYLNTMSKGQYKDIDARAHVYILQAMENGDLK